jgi:hypothetical protein
MCVAGPKRRRESATSASPIREEGLCQSAAPPGIGEAPEAATGRRARELRLERLPMSIRNGTSSSSNPQPPTAASGRRRPSEEEEEEVCGWISK